MCVKSNHWTVASLGYFIVLIENTNAKCSTLMLKYSVARVPNVLHS